MKSITESKISFKSAVLVAMSHNNTAAGYHQPEDIPFALPAPPHILTCRSCGTRAISEVECKGPFYCSDECEERGAEMNQSNDWKFDTEEEYA